MVSSPWRFSENHRNARSQIATEIESDYQTAATVAPPQTTSTKPRPALAAGTYKLSWSAIIDYSSGSRSIYVRMQNTTDAATLWETIFRPVNASDRQSVAGYTHVIFAGAAKTFAMQFHNTNVGDTSGIAYSRMDIVRVS
jgi:hypothetical protein